MEKEWSLDENRWLGVVIILKIQVAVFYFGHEPPPPKCLFEEETQHATDEYTVVELRW